MKKGVFFLVAIPTLLILMVLGIKGMTIQNPSPKDCDIKEITVINIEESTSYDIMFYDEQGDFYYINRGIEQGLTVEGLKSKVLNKKVTLHLPRIMFGKVESEHIAQLSLGNEVIFTEFRDTYDFGVSSN